MPSTKSVTDQSSVATQFDGLGVVINRACGAHRQPLAHRVVAFLVATIARFGRPTAPIRFSSIPAVALGGDGPDQQRPKRKT